MYIVSHYTDCMDHYLQVSKRRHLRLLLMSCHYTQCYDICYFVQVKILLHNCLEFGLDKKDTCTCNSDICWQIAPEGVLNLHSSKQLTSDYFVIILIAILSELSLLMWKRGTSLYCFTFFF